MKTFAVIAIAAFAVFVVTAVYLLTGGGRSHELKPAWEAAPHGNAGQPQPTIRRSRAYQQPRAAPSQDLAVVTTEEPVKEPQK